MTLLASNLGQIIGRLMCADDGVPPAPPKRPNRAAQVLELASRQPQIACRDQVAALGISSDHAAVLLGAMHKAGKLARTGERFYYRYSLP